nr:MAG TPA: hypothetical protein [Caudoviricetes sp.]
MLEFLKKKPSQEGPQESQFRCSFYWFFPGVGILRIRVLYSLAIYLITTSVSVGY